MQRNPPISQPSTVSLHRLCAISIDMDPIDHYLRARTLEPLAVTDLNAVYTEALPRYLDIFDEFGVRATFFVVGKDAEPRENARRLQEAVARGHEIASHTMLHHQRFRHLPWSEKEREVRAAEEILTDCVQRRVIGFRAPGWGVDDDLLRMLEDRGYSYDSSVFPSRLLPLVAHANRMLNKGRLRMVLNVAGARAPKGPYHPSPGEFGRPGAMRLLEIPPTVLPLLELPFLGTLLFLAGRAPFQCSFQWQRRFRLPLVYELHGIELVDYYASINDPHLAVKPGLTKTIAEKVSLYRYMLSSFARHYSFVTMAELAELHRNAHPRPGQ